LYIQTKLTGNINIARTRQPIKFPDQNFQLTVTYEGTMQVSIQVGIHAEIGPVDVTDSPCQVILTELIFLIVRYY
jgi:hypothetical protein